LKNDFTGSIHAFASPALPSNEQRSDEVELDSLLGTHLNFLKLDQERENFYFQLQKATASEIEIPTAAAPASYQTFALFAAQFPTTPKYGRVAPAIMSLHLCTTSVIESVALLCVLIYD
jgi:hypothetical protein